MKKIYKDVFLYLIILFSIYSALIIGLSWDQGTVLGLGKLRLNYFFSLGKNYGSTSLGEDFSFFIRLYPGTYAAIVAFITQLFPKSFEVETLHIFNTFIGISTIFGISKIARELFNKNIGYIVFVISFFNPIFFGHMAISDRDLVWAFCNIWITYSLLKYFKQHEISEKKNRIVILLGILLGLGLSARVSFFITLLPIFIFLLYDSFVLNKICKKRISLKIFFKDILISVSIAYFVLIAFWPEVYSNILTLPFKFSYESTQFFYGVPNGLINGVVYETIAPPKNYILVLLYYKLPEYFVISYLIFFLILLKDSGFYKRNITNFYYKIILIFVIISFPNLVVIFSPYPVYDNLRLFLYLIPYLSIIPGIVIFYFFKKIKHKINKLILIFYFLLFTYSLYNFFSLTPYQYTYLNIFSGKFSESTNKFESDYFATSIVELIKKTKFKEKQVKLALCGVGKGHLKFIINHYKFNNIIIVPVEKNYDYIMMTNRLYLDPNATNLKQCHDKFDGKIISSVKRNGLILSVIKSKKI